MLARSSRTSHSGEMSLADVHPRISHAGRMRLASVLSRISHAGKISSGGAVKDQACGPAEMCISHRQERHFMLELPFRVDESAMDDPGDGQGTVSHRRERYFMLK